MPKKTPNIVIDHEILKTLTDNLPDMLWIKDLEGYYLFANQAICDNLLMAKDTNEPIGKNDVFFALRERATHPENPNWHTFGELCHNSDDVTVEHNKSMRFEEYGNVKGQLMYLEVHKAPFYDDSGKVLGVVGSGRDITEFVLMKKQMEEQQKDFEYKAYHDYLTGLPNRLLFLDRLEHGLQKSERTQQQLALLFIDLDHFKNINDIYGHDAGDETLKIVSRRLRETVRNTDTLSRLGGDEFTLIMEDVKDIFHVSSLANKVLEVIAKPIVVDNIQHSISGSIGISLNSTKETISANNMLKFADSAMYRSKELGRNRFEFYSNEITETAFKRIMLEEELRIALKEEQFEVYFQPKINLLSNKLCGVECLIRWNHPTLGLLAPDSFIPCAEDTGLIVAIDRWVYQYSLNTLKQWYDKGLEGSFVMAMNLSALQLEQSDFVAFISHLVKKNGLTPANVELEITETQVMKNLEANKLILKQLEKFGLRLAMDDFGTGYSSLAYLKQLKMDTLKIDRSFIADVPENEEDTSIVLAILAMAKSLGLQVVAEGVETQEQVDFLLQKGCHCVQGYFYSKPLSLDDIEQLFQDKMSIQA